MEGKTAIVAGATGLIGNELVEMLCSDADFGKVLVISRRNPGFDNPKVEVLLTDFDDLDSVADNIRGDMLFCCLGTTIAKAGSRSAFRKVDEEYPLKLADVAVANGIEKFLIITAMGADPSSWVFYNRVKGEVEEGLKAKKLPFLRIFRPSLLLGEREEYRTGEEMGKAIMGLVSPLMVGPLKKYRPIQATVVARAMIIESKKTGPALAELPSDEIEALVT